MVVELSPDAKKPNAGRSAWSRLVSSIRQRMGLDLMDYEGDL